jgi:hypothetical protein
MMEKLGQLSAEEMEYALRYPLLNIISVHRIQKNLGKNPGFVSSILPLSETDPEIHWRPCSLVLFSRRVWGYYYSEVARRIL